MEEKVIGKVRLNHQFHGYQNNKQYREMLQQLTQYDLVEDNKLKERGKTILATFYEDSLEEKLNSIFRQIKLTASDEECLFEELLYNALLVVWFKSSSEQKDAIESYSQQQGLHKAFIPAMAAVYVLEEGVSRGLLRVEDNKVTFTSKLTEAYVSCSDVKSYLDGK